MALRNTLPRFTLLAGLVGFAVMVTYLVLYWDSNPPTPVLPRAPDPDQIDVYAEQAHGVKFDATGKRVQTFTSPRVTHYPLRGETRLESPVLQMLSAKGKIWDGTARTGILVGDDEIKMRGDVIIHDADRSMQLRTEALDYFPKRNEVTSAVAVLLRKNNDTTRAIGMRADLDQNRIELLHQVEGYHVQPQ
jgi:lipopolysaccharide export system protein LptC